jgi:hypothetical protein
VVPTLTAMSNDTNLPLRGVALVGGTAVALTIARHAGWPAAALGLAVVAVVPGLVLLSERKALHARLGEYLDEAETKLRAGNVDHARTLAMQVLGDDAPPAVRARAERFMVDLHLASEDREAAARAFARLPGDAPRFVDALAELEELHGRTSNARLFLELELAARGLGRRGARLLIDILARDGELERAVQVAAECADVLGDDELANVRAAAVERGVDATAISTLFETRRPKD